MASAAESAGTSHASGPGGQASGAPAWHAMPTDAVLRRLGTDASGLTQAEAAARLARCGANRLPAPPRPSVLRRFLAQFWNVLILVLLASSLASVLLGHLVDATVILAVVLINAVIGVVQEGRAERALEVPRDRPNTLTPHQAGLPALPCAPWHAGCGARMRGLQAAVQPDRRRPGAPALPRG